MAARASSLIDIAREIEVSESPAAAVAYCISCFEADQSREMAFVIHALSVCKRHVLLNESDALFACLMSRDWMMPYALSVTAQSLIELTLRQPNPQDRPPHFDAAVAMLNDRLLNIDNEQFLIARNLRPRGPAIGRTGRDIAFATPLSGPSEAEFSAGHALGALNPMVVRICQTRPALGEYTIEGGYYFYNGSEFIVADADMEPLAVSRYSALTERLFRENVARNGVRQVDSLHVCQDMSPHHNFSHWVCDWLPRISYFSATRDRVTLPLRGNLKSFQRDAIQLLGNVAVVRVENDDVYRADMLHVLSSSRHFLHPLYLSHPDVIAQLARVSQAVTGHVEGDRVYLSRGQDSRRAWREEGAFMTALADHNFRIVDPGQLGLADQIRAVRKARIVVAPHGAALSNVIFADACAAVVEIFPPNYGTHSFQVTTFGAKAEYFHYTPHRSSPEISLIGQSETFSLDHREVLSSLTGAGLL